MNSRKSKSKTSKFDKNHNGKIMKLHNVKEREKKPKRFKGRGGKREVCTKPTVSNTCLQVLKQSFRIRNTICPYIELFRDVPL